jgi:AraC family transcriptional regulator, regulatory protein of adaptative response / DNA-3-methyladenine glycosylase II
MDMYWSWSQRSSQGDSNDRHWLPALAEECEFRALRLAARLGISARHLRRIFQHQFGCSPQAWLREQRLQCARRMLNPERSVKEVAFTLGFRGQSQFSRDFKARFSCTPSVFTCARRASAEGAPEAGR